MEQFKTSDLYFASYLIASGCKFTNTEKKAGHKCKTVFVIEPGEQDIRELSSEFFSGAAIINVSQFISTLKNLKSLCFTE